MATDLNGWPAKRAAKYSLQPPRTSKPQLAGASGAIATPRCLQQRHPGAVGAQPRPARAAQRQDRGLGPYHALALRRRRIARRPRSRPADEAMPHVKLHARARAAGAAMRAAAAPPSCRWETPGPNVPTKVAMPSPCAQSRSACGAELPAARARPAGGARRNARRRCSNGSECVRLRPPLPASRNLRPDRRHGVEDLAPGRPAWDSTSRRHQAGGACADDRRPSWHHHQPPCPVRNAACTGAPGYAACTAAR